MIIMLIGIYVATSGDEAGVSKKLFVVKSSELTCQRANDFLIKQILD